MALEDLTTILDDNSFQNGMVCITENCDEYCWIGCTRHNSLDSRTFQQHKFPDQKPQYCTGFEWLFTEIPGEDDIYKPFFNEAGWANLIAQAAQMIYLRYVKGYKFHENCCFNDLGVDNLDSDLKAYYDKMVAFQNSN